MNDLKRVYAFTCPHCGGDIRYDRNEYDRKIAELKAEVTSIDSQLTVHKMDGDPEWKRRCKKAREIKLQQLAELKAKRADGNAYVTDRISNAFKGVVKEKIGEENYLKWIMEAERRVEYASVEELMKK